MRYGYFDDTTREYVITRPDTPLPWFNYLGCEEYFGLISHTAGGYSFYKDARLRRLTRYRYNNAPMDIGGRYIYLRDKASGEYWSPTWMPVRKSLENYNCRHGIGTTKISSTFKGISAEVLYFVPMGQNLEIWRLRVKNTRNKPAELTSFASVEFCLWDANDDATNFQRNYNVGEVEIVDGVIYHKTEYRERRNHFAYFTSSAEMQAYDTQRENFLGVYNGWDSPQAVMKGTCSNSHAHGWAPVGVIQSELNLAPGEEREVIFLLGYTENPQDEKFENIDKQIINKTRALPVIARYRKSAEVQKALDDLHKYWDGLFSRFQVVTPDEHANRMINIWNAYQCMVTFNMSRSASGFETGIGRGMGFRDSTQDLFGFVHMVPERARQRLLDIAATQLETGGAYHQYQPLTKRGNDAVGGNFNDDPLWLVLAVCAYIKETGDQSILDEPVSYDSKPGSEQPLYEHLQRAIQYILDRRGPHGLPLIGRADWNDCLNLNCFSSEPGESFQTTTSKDGKVAESVFIGGMLVLAANEMADLADFLHKDRDVEFYKKVALDMEPVVIDAGWDGEWFRRAYDDFGNPLGSADCKEGQIFIEPQGMCIMAGIGLSDGKAEKALRSVEKRLATNHGIVVHNPGFTRYYLHLGEISTYPPGYKENASVFCHTNPWIMISETKLGHGDKAFDYYRRICPSVREAISEIHRCEPYVYAQTIAGREAPTEGEAKNSWLTGTAAWNFVAITQYILGIRPSLKGLVIQPVLPSDWQDITVKRFYRDVVYDIHIRRVGPGNSVDTTVDGKKISTEVIPLPPRGISSVKVDVLVGK
ncbi:MAG: glycosyl transferase [Leptolinea sp.]|jgi:cellobiose phosphorylase|nr:glycosyl transferase [Leptolinea sp.]